MELCSFTLTLLLPLTPHTATAPNTPYCYCLCHHGALLVHPHSAAAPPHTATAPNTLTLLLPLTPYTATACVTSHRGTWTACIPHAAGLRHACTALVASGQDCTAG